MSDDSRVFHTEEYKIMKQQKYSLIDRISTIVQYVLGGIAALYAWLITHKLNVSWGFYLPFFLALSGTALVGIVQLRIKSIDKYLQGLERYLDDHAQAVEIETSVGALRVSGWEDFRISSKSSGSWRPLIIGIFIIVSLLTLIPIFFPPSVVP